MIHGDDGSADIGDILKIVQDNFRIWQGLLHASSGTLNPPKCSWTPFMWSFNHLGHAQLTPIPEHPSAQIYASDLDGKQHALRINKPSDAVRLLGVHIAADGNYQKELTVLKQKQQKYVQFLLRTPLSRQEARVIYKQCYLPTVSYPLPATNMPPDAIYATQSTVTSLFLTRMGYPRHIPRSVVYAPDSVGGLGMRHLGHEQGVQQTLQLLRHPPDSTNGKLYELTIDQYQIYVGIRHPILEDTKEIPWIPHGWISSIRQFLHRNSTSICLQNPWTPTERHVNDRCIMDDAMRQLPNTTLKTINSVRMYLRVAMLSEICDTNGNTILNHMLDDNATPFPSLLTWPYQPVPTRAAWKVWRQTIRTLYTTSSESQTLTTALGPWIRQNTKVQCEWQWFACHITNTLYQRNERRWRVYTKLHSCRRYVVYGANYTRTTRTLPDTATPATPLQTPDGENIILNLPIHPWCQQLENTPPDHLQRDDSDSASSSDDDSTNDRSILDRLMTPASTWEQELWHRIACHSRDDELNELLTQGTPITACSDAAVDTAKFSTFSWIIHGERALWQGEGIVPGLVEDVYSGRSEAFGVYTALRFLSNYISHFPNTYHKAPVIMMYCDNQGVIDRIHKLPPTRPLQPRQTTEDDYDVYAAIRSTLSDLAPIQVQLRHVKGHQDQHPRPSRLPLPAILNIECDKRASEYLITARRMKPQPNLPIPQSYPLLKIAGQIIVRNIQSSLRDAASTPDYREYLRKKLKWSARDCENVNWISLKMAIQKFERNDQQRLQKFLHDWLPLRASPHMSQPASDHSCPVCHQNNEDLWHFLECQHPTRHPAYQQMQTALQDLHRRHHVDPYMMQLLWQGIDSIHNQ